MRNGQQKLMSVLQSCHKALAWLHSEEGIDLKEAPDEYKDNLKQLDKLGIVYKRNNRSLGIRWQRLRRLAERNMPGGKVPFEPEELLIMLKGPEPSTPMFSSQ